MSKPEVEAILGVGMERPYAAGAPADALEMIWEGENQFFTVSFLNNEVQGKGVHQKEETSEL